MPWPQRPHRANNGDAQSPFVSIRAHSWQVPHRELTTWRQGADNPYMPVVTDELIFHSIVANRAASPRKETLALPAGPLASVSRLTRDAELRPLDVVVTRFSPTGVVLRSPIGLDSGALYRMRIGRGQDASQLRSLASRRRGDGGYDIGAQFVRHAA